MERGKMEKNESEGFSMCDHEHEHTHADGTTHTHTHAHEHDHENEHVHTHDGCAEHTHCDSCGGCE